MNGWVILQLRLGRQKLSCLFVFLWIVYSLPLWEWSRVRVGSSSLCSATYPKCEEHLAHTSRINDTNQFFSDETKRLQKPFSSLWNYFHITDINLKKTNYLPEIQLEIGESWRMDLGILSCSFQHGESLTQVWEPKRLDPSQSCQPIFL